jgi:hypothetical protein
MEKLTPKKDKKRICNAFEEALIHFGKDQIEIWLEYIDFLYSAQSSLSSSENDADNDLKSISDIYWRAMKQLGGYLLEDFSQKFCLYKINLNSLSKSSQSMQIDEKEVDLN